MSCSPNRDFKGFCAPTPASNRHKTVILENGEGKESFVVVAYRDTIPLTVPTKSIELADVWGRALHGCRSVTPSMGFVLFTATGEAAPSAVLNIPTVPGAVLISTRGTLGN